MHRCTISESEIAAMRALRAQGWGVRQIARHFRADHRWVSRMLRGLRRKHSLPPAAYSAARQVEVLAFVTDHWRRRGYGPTLRQIGAHLGIGHKTVLKHLCCLARKGAIPRPRRWAWRGWVPAGEGLPDDREGG